MRRPRLAPSVFYLVALAIAGIAAAASVEVRGYVVEGGEPVAGVLVRLLAESDPLDPSSPAVEVARGSTGERGRFALRPPWVLDWAPVAKLVELSRPGLPPRVIDFGRHGRPGPGASIDLGELSLGALCRIEGRIKGRSGARDSKPESAVVVLWQEGSDRPTASTRARRDGSFAFEDITGGSYHLGIERRGHPPIRGSSVRACDGGGPVTVELPLEASLVGRVVDPQGQGIAGASVRLVAAPPPGAPTNWLEPLATETNLDGEFELRRPVSKSYSMEVSKPGFTSRSLKPRSLFHPDQNRLDTVHPTVALYSSQHIVGTVIDADELFLGDALIEISLADPELGSDPLVSLESDRFGDFISPPLEPGDYQVQVTLDGYQAVRAKASISSNATAWAEVELRMLAEGSSDLRVEVLDSAGSPVENAGVWAFNREQDGYYTCPAGTDGSCVLQAVPDDRELEIGIEHGLYGRVVRESTWRIDRDGRSLRFDLGATPWEVTPLAGVVVDPDGEPVAGASLEMALLALTAFISYETVTDLDGRFDFERLQEGSYWIRVNKEGFPELVTGLKVAPREPEARVQLTRGAAIWGRTGLEEPQSATSGSPGVRVYAERVRQREMVDPRVITLDGNGYPTQTVSGSVESGLFRIEEVPPGRWNVLAMGADDAPYYGRGLVEIAPGDDLLELDLEPIANPMLPPPKARVSGRVVDATTGKGLAGAEVMDGHITRRSRRVGGERVTTDTNGTFTFDHDLTLPASLLVSHAGYARAAVEAGAESPGAPLLVAMAPGASFTYSIESPDGAELPALTLSLENPEGAYIRRGGAFEDPPVGTWEDAPPGSWDLVVKHSWGEVRVPIRVPGPDVRVILPVVGDAQLRISDLELNLADGWLDGVTGMAVPISTSTVAGPIPLHEQVWVQGLTPGLWSFELTAPDGRSWSGEGQISSRRTTTIFLR